MRAMASDPTPAALLAAMPQLEDLDVDNRRVLVRVDFNVPLDGTSITDDTRIRAALPTLQSLRDRGARLVVASHLGRPKGKVVPALSMEPIGAHLAGLLDCEVRIPDEVVGDGVRKLVTDTRAEHVVMLENLRFDPGETSNDPRFAEALAGLADAYVNDAFGVSHRAHASVVGVAEKVRDRAPGQLVRRELEALSRLVDDPARPFAAIIGGAKVSDKLGVLVALVERLRAGDRLLIGGAMANSFLAARGTPMARSLVEADRFRDCLTVLEKAAARDVQVLLPTDLRVGTGLDVSEGRVVEVETPLLADEEMALDIGPDSVRRYGDALTGAATVFWNGPMGVFENPDQVSHVSTGGGASLELVEGRALPGLVALLPEPEIDRGLEEDEED